jgi:hypothetical protein
VHCNTHNQPAINGCRALPPTQPTAQPTRLARVQAQQRLQLDVLLRHVGARLAGAVGRVWQHVVEGLGAAACKDGPNAGPTASVGSPCYQQPGTRQPGFRAGWLQDCQAVAKRILGRMPRRARASMAHRPSTAGWGAAPASLSTPICCTHSSPASHATSQPTTTPLQRQTWPGFASQHKGAAGCFVTASTCLHQTAALQPAVAAVHD